ncbi:uncharacterized protein [Acropora muricata]|uniref:uncharacterized protein isoform X3 n=1 Tax=Acropora muricata TaxID=159855 RepID=UPI0034E59A81
MGPLLQIYVTLSALIFKFIAAYQDGECRQLSFPADYMFRNRRLMKHVIETIKVVDLNLCELQCYHQPNCVSINFKVILSSKGLHECELNNATHRSNDNELMNKDGCVYKGAESACDRAGCENGGTCQSGFTDKGYQCVCLPGFTSAHCEKAMPFARSVVLHFPAEIHRAQGVSEVAPQLLQALDVEKIAAVQFLKNGQVPLHARLPSTGTISLRAPISSLETSLFLSPPLTSPFVPCLCVTCLSKFLIVM